MTMKIRFMKSVVNEEVRSRLISDSEQVMFESCDQVQMKLTQLELNTVRLMCTSNSSSSSSLASNLGMINTCKRKEAGPEKYMHADAHQPFMDLLLEQQQGKASEFVPKGEEEEEREGEGKKERKEGKRRKKDELVLGQSTVFSVSMRNQNCQCFACIGAVAAQQTDVSASCFCHETVTIVDPWLVIDKY
uniref:Uncharacterized protein n=1 Tax=Amphimedon queenslandica TaxID=400682 RepID=A0A1X7SGL9_AMPQE